MSDLKQPFTSKITDFGKMSFDAVKDTGSLSMVKSVYVPSQQNQIQENEFKEKDVVEPSKSFIYLFTISLIFQFAGTVIIALHLLLNFFTYGQNQNSKVVFYLSLGYELASVISFSTYMYLCFESVQWYPLNITKSIRLSFLFTVTAFILALFIFTETNLHSWVCSQTYTGKDCFPNGTSLFPVNYQTMTCTIKLPNSECYGQLVNLIVKYSILPCSGVPLLFIISAFLKYIVLTREKQRRLKESGVLQSSIQSMKKQPKIIELNQKKGDTIVFHPYDNSVGPINDDSNFFSTKQKVNYNPDLNTSQVVYSKDNIFNPTTNRNEGLERNSGKFFNPQYNLGDNEL